MYYLWFFLITGFYMKWNEENLVLVKNEIFTDLFRLKAKKVVVLLNGFYVYIICYQYSG